MDPCCGFIDVFWCSWVYLNLSRTLRLVDRIWNKMFKCSAEVLGFHPHLFWSVLDASMSWRLWGGKIALSGIWRTIPWKRNGLFLSHKTHPCLAGRVIDFWFNLTNNFFTRNSPVIQCLVSQEDSLASGKLFKQRLDENFSVAVLFTFGLVTSLS